MPVKLIAFIILLLVIVSFIGFNAENTSDIRIWLGDNGLLRDVPIYVSFFIMYLIGVLSVVPFIIGWGRRQRNRSGAKPSSQPETAPESGKKSGKKLRVLGSAGRKKAADGLKGGEENPETVSDTKDKPVSG
jgi:hypothetical protein